MELRVFPKATGLLRKIEGGLSYARFNLKLGMSPLGDSNEASKVDVILWDFSFCQRYSLYVATNAVFPRNTVSRI